MVPSLWQTTAFLLNIKVDARFLGLASLLKMIPTMQAWIITPTIDWKQNMRCESHCDRETDKQLDPSRLRAKTRSQCQDCVAAFLKVTPPSLPVFFTLARLKHFSQLPSSPAAELGNNKFRRNSRASALCNGRQLNFVQFLFVFVCL